MGVHVQEENKAGSGIFIRQGFTSMTGHWVWKMWAVYVPSEGIFKFSTLAKAKEFALKSGASGKWIRSVTNTGPRQVKQTRYDDCGETRKRAPKPVA